MLRNYIKIALRNLWKHKGFSFINIFGLALGIACSLLMILHVKNELRYDTGYPSAPNLYRVTMESMEDGRHWAATAPGIGAEMTRRFPQIQGMVRFYKSRPLQVLSYTDANGVSQRHEERNGLFADANVPAVFNLHFLSGDAATALEEPGSIVLTDQLAIKYFGTTDVLNKVLREEVNQQPLRVTGVIATPEVPSHATFNYLISLSTFLNNLPPEMRDNHTWNALYTYILLPDQRACQAVKDGLPAFNQEFYAGLGETPAEISAHRRLHLQPVRDIHLHSKLEKEMEANSDIRYVYIFSIAALFILLIAAVNFINIFTVQANGRTKEIGLRKVIGALRPQLAQQFLGESFCITLIAAGLAIAMVYAALPLFNQVTGRQLHIEELVNLKNLWILLGLTTAVGLLAGLYPAWIISGYRPVNALKGANTRVAGTVRKSLIVFQFTIAVFLIFSTVVMYRQLKLFHDKDLGFDQEQLVAITMYDETWKHFDGLRDALAQNKDVISYSITSTLPGERFSMQSVKVLGRDKEEETIRAIWADEQLLPTMKLQLTAGENFRPQWPAVSPYSFWLNETAVKKLGLQNPIGTRVRLDGDTGVIVGVVKDFNFASLHAPIDPLIVEYRPLNANYLLVRSQAGKLPETLAFLEQQVKTIAPASVFTYNFIDDKLETLYASENRMMQLFRVFSGFAILVSCLGLFGLVVYASRLRVKEVGIRKTLGASVTGVTLLLSRDFIKLVAIAVLIAWPLSWWVMHSWLSGFAYRVSINGWTFLVSGLLTLLVAVLTVGAQAMKAAAASPVKSLRSE